jgi:hypothetical protein
VIDQEYSRVRAAGEMPSNLAAGSPVKSHVDLGRAPTEVNTPLVGEL